MVITIDSFKFDVSYEKIVAELSIPQEYIIIQDNIPEVYIKKVTIGTQVTYDTDDNDFSTTYFEDEDNKMGPIIDCKQYYKNGIVFECDTNDAHAGDTEHYPNYKPVQLTLELPIEGSQYMKVSDLFFIKVETNNDYSIDIPCSMTGDTWGSVYDQFSVESKGMQYMRELANTCETPEGMIDYILNKEAIDVAAGCGDYSTMIERYEELNGTTVTTSTSKVSNYKKCGCNG